MKATNRSFSNSISNDGFVTPNKLHLEPLIGSQYISQIHSPNKGDRKATESRCFLKLSNKMQKLVNNHNLIKLNPIKHAERRKRKLTYEMFEVVNTKLDERKSWLSLNKQDQVERESLFIKLTKVTEARNGFVVCDCAIELEKSKDVISFKYPTNLKTLIPTHYASQIEISNQARLEYISPFFILDNDYLKISFILNPFWIAILDHGVFENAKEDDDFEVIYTNPNAKSTKSLLAITDK